MKTKRRVEVADGVFLGISLLGLAVLLYPFWAPSLPQPDQGRAALLLLSGVLAILLAALVGEAQAGLTPHTVALIGALVGLNSVIRMVETVIPLPGGFSPVFLLIILVGQAFGARLGFLMGALTMLVSGPLTAGGLGPWTPYQMLAAGWVGMGAAWLPKEHGKLAALLVYGAIWGLLYGALTDLQYWPYALGAPDLTWVPGLGPWATLVRYGRFYLVTSFVWDLLRLVGNVVLLLVLGAPLASVLDRFQRRARITWEPA